jgi:hypothetical protein
MKCRGPWRLNSFGLGWWAVLALALTSQAASAQVIQIGGGSSSLLEAYGGSFELQAGESTGRFDLGVLGQPEIGFSYSRPFHGWNLTAGDQSIPFVLPTDLFNQSYYFLGRGVRLQDRHKHDRLLVYAGTTSMGFRTPFLNVARSERGVGLVFYERQLSPTTRFCSYNVLSSQQTTLQAFDWTPRQGLKLATTSGIGNNQGYWAGSLDFKRDWIAVQSSYTLVGDSFKRVEVEAPLVAETAGANLRVQLHPMQRLAVVLSHQNYLNPIPMSVAGPTAAVDSLGTSVLAGGFGIHGSVFHSRTRVTNLQGFSFGAQRSFLERFEVGSAYFASRTRGSHWNSVSTSVREALTRRFTLSQVIAESNGRTTVSFDGSFVSNRLSIGLEHQTFFFPFAGQTGSPFRQALLINVQLQLPHDVRLHAATNVDALGRLRYTSYANSFLYPHGSRQERGRGRPKLPVYVVRGTVMDDQARPIRGAALEIDGQLVFTDSRGEFLLRVKKAKPYSLAVLPDQFMFQDRYEVITAPTAVRGEREEMAKSYEIILRRAFARRPVVAATGTPAEGRAAK